jgi:hypothetical protein
MNEAPTNRDDDAGSRMLRLPWWAYVLFVLAVIGGALWALQRRGGDITPLTVALVALGGIVLVGLRVLVARGAYQLGRGLRRRVDG